MLKYKIKIIKIRNLLEFMEKINNQGEKGWKMYKSLIKIDRKNSQTYLILFKKKEIDWYGWI